MQFSSYELHQNRLSEGHSLLRNLNSCPYFHTFTVGVLWNSVWGVCSQCCSAFVSLWTSEQLGPAFVMNVNEIIFASVPWGTPCADLLHSAIQTPNCSLQTAYVFYQAVARKAESASLLNPPLYVSWRFTAPHLTNLPNRCMFGSNRLILLTLACCIINNNSVNKNTHPGFDSESHLSDFLFRFFIVHSPIFLESCLSVA